MNPNYQLPFGKVVAAYATAYGRASNPRKLPTQVQIASYARSYTPEPLAHLDIAVEHPSDSSRAMFIGLRLTEEQSEELGRTLLSHSAELRARRLHPEEG